MLEGVFVETATRFDARAFLDRLLEPDDPPEAAVMPDALPADWRALYEERAGIREFDGGQCREHAEAEALREVLAMMRQDGAE